MRVRISYGAHIEDVPEEIDRMFDFARMKSHKITKQIEQLDSMLADEDVESAAAIMHKLRTSLNEMDLRLADMQQISEGYLNYKANEGVENVNEGRPSVVTTGNSPVDTTPQQPTSDSNNSGA